MKPFYKYLFNFCVATILIFLSAYSAANDAGTLISLASKTGSKLFNRSYYSKTFWPLDNQFVTQLNPRYCSIASSIMVLNALQVSPPPDPSYKPYHLFTQKNFFNPSVTKILPIDRVNKVGATLDEIESALKTYDVATRTIHADMITVSQFRAVAKDILQMPNTYMIINYSRKALGQKGGGHMSPIAAYDKRSDRLLILDVARYRYPPIWVKTTDLWQAMHTIDDQSHAYRGFVIVQKK